VARRPHDRGPALDLCNEPLVEEWRKITAPPELRDFEVNCAGARFSASIAVAVARCRLLAVLAEAGAAAALDMKFHEPLRREDLSPRLSWVPSGRSSVQTIFAEGDDGRYLPLGSCRPSASRLGHDPGTRRVRKSFNKSCRDSIGESKLVFYGAGYLINLYRLFVDAAELGQQRLPIRASGTLKTKPPRQMGPYNTTVRRIPIPKDSQMVAEMGESPSQVPKSQMQ
jgi:hypothetical protein